MRRIRNRLRFLQCGGAGWDRPLVNGPLLAALHRRALTTWLTPHDRLLEHRTRFTSPVLSGEDVTIDLRLDESAPAGEVALSSTMRDRAGHEVSSSRARCQLADG